MGSGALFDSEAIGPKVRGITIVVPGRPIAQPRPRFFAQLAAGQKLWVAAKRAKNPQELRELLKPLAKASVFRQENHAIQDYRKRVRGAAYEVFLGTPWQCPVYLEILFLMPRPKNKIWKTKPMPRYPHTSVPDKDNLEKGVKDALKGVVYRDDSQVADGRVSKWVCAGGETPKTIIKLAKIEGTENESLKGR